MNLSGASVVRRKLVRLRFQWPDTSDHSARHIGMFSTMMRVRAGHDIARKHITVIALVGSTGAMIDAPNWFLMKCRCPQRPRRCREEEWPQHISTFCGDGNNPAAVREKRKKNCKNEFDVRFHCFLKTSENSVFVFTTNTLPRFFLLLWRNVGRDVQWLHLNAIQEPCWLPPAKDLCQM